MRTRWAFGLTAAAGLITALALALTARPSAAGGPPRRTKVTCEEFRADMEKYSKMTLKAGDWAKVPPALRVLPPKASVCGAAAGTFTVYVASPLFGKELADYYTPIFEKLGCKPVKCEFEDKKTACNCRHSSGIGRIGTEMLNEAYAISWFGGK